MWCEGTHQLHIKGKQVVWENIVCARQWQWQPRGDSIVKWSVDKLARNSVETPHSIKEEQSNLIMAGGFWPSAHAHGGCGGGAFRQQLGPHPVLSLITKDQPVVEARSRIQ